MQAANRNSLSQGQNYREVGLKNELHRHYIRDFFEKYVRPKVSRAKDTVRKVARMFAVSIRGKKFTRFEFEKVRA